MHRYKKYVTKQVRILTEMYRYEKYVTKQVRILISFSYFDGCPRHFKGPNAQYLINETPKNKKENSICWSKTTTKTISKNVYRYYFSGQLLQRNWTNSDSALLAQEWPCVVPQCGQPYDREVMENALLQIVQRLYSTTCRIWCAVCLRCN